MEKELFKICGIALLCVAFLVVTKELKGGYPWAVRAVGVILVASLLVINIDGLKNEMNTFLRLGSASEYIAIMLKCLGISFLVKICSDICRDCGEGSLAFGIESAGKLCVIYMCLPLISDMLGYAEEILGMGDI
jgi:stage III sporulation protein AD